MNQTATARTARDIALEGLSDQQRAKLLELADLHNIPNDDSIYWIGAILRPDHEATSQQLDEALDAIADGLEVIGQHLLKLDAKVTATVTALPTAETTSDDTVTATPADAAASTTTSSSTTSARFPAWAPALAASLVGAVIGTAGFVWGYQSRSVPPAAPAAATESSTPVSAPSSQEPDLATSSAAPNATDNASTGIEVTPQLRRANEDRLQRCLADGNTKCTILLQPES